MKRFTHVLPAIPLAVAAMQIILLSTGGADPFKDDAYICLRYAHNLVSGMGLVFNPGERAEGFTTPLWTLLSAALLAIKASPVTALKSAGAIAFFGLVWTTWIATRDILSKPLRLVPPLTVAATGAIAYWALSGLETVAFSLAVMAGIYHFVQAARTGARGTMAGGTWFGVAILLRPEAIAWFLLLVLALWLWPFVTRKDNSLATPDRPMRRWWDPQALRPLWSTVLPAFLLAGAWQVFRLSYYGEWLPNTFHAKVEWQFYVLGRGLHYLARASVATPLAVFFALVLGTRSAWRRPEVAFPALVAGFHLLYLVLIGGDYMVHARFVVPILAPLALAWGAAIDQWLRPPSSTSSATPEPNGIQGARSHPFTPRHALLAFATIAAIGTGLIPYVQAPGVRDPDPHLTRYRKAGHWIKQYLKPSALVATPAIGAIGYLGETRILDTLGIVDRYLAHKTPDIQNLRARAGHARGDGAYVLKRAPDIILLANVWVRPVPLEPRQVAANPQTLTLTDRLLFGMPEFLERYEIVSYPMPGDEWFGMAVRRDSPYHPDSPQWTGPAPQFRSH